MAQASWHDIARAHRIQVFGVTGVGKTTAARKLARIIGGSAIDLDEINWAPAHLAAWTERPTNESYAMVRQAVSAERFVIAGNYAKFRTAIEPRLDAGIFLDYPAPFAFARLLKRTLTRVITRERVCNGNVESWRRVLSKDSIVVWWLKTFQLRRRNMNARIEDPSDVPILRVRSHAQLDELMGFVVKQRAS